MGLTASEGTAKEHDWRHSCHLHQASTLEAKARGRQKLSAYAHRRLRLVTHLPAVLSLKALHVKFWQYFWKFFTNPFYIAVFLSSSLRVKGNIWTLWNKQRYRENDPLKICKEWLPTQTRLAKLSQGWLEGLFTLACIFWLGSRLLSSIEFSQLTADRTSTGYVISSIWIELID